MMKFALVAMCALAQSCLADTVPAEVVEWDKAMARCPYGYSIVSCECSPPGACQAVSIMPDPDSSGMCHARAKFGESATAKGTCQKGIKTRLAVVYENGAATCPDDMTLKQCFAYSKPWRWSGFKIQPTEVTDNSCKIKGPLSEADKYSSSFFVQAICVA